ncbi:MAG: hypothetical protein ABW000_07120 [Actinoplanes sp.]
MRHLSARRLAAAAIYITVLQLFAGSLAALYGGPIYWGIHFLAVIVVLTLAGVAVGVALVRQVQEEQTRTLRVMLDTQYQDLPAHSPP